MTRSLKIIILGAGKGTRMHSDLPKVFHAIANRPMLGHVLDTALALEPEQVITVIGPDMAELAALVAPHPCVEQTERLGTAHAVGMAQDYLRGFEGDVVILYGDTPLMTPATLKQLIRARAHADNPAVVVLGFTPDDPTGYGRLILQADGSLSEIVEQKDASDAQRSVTLCNSGVMCFDGAKLPDLLAEIGNDNANGEYYLTDAVGLARQKGWVCSVVEAPATETLGVNSRAQLAEAEAVLQTRLRRRAMAQGASLVAPETVHFSADTKLGRDVVVEPNVVFGPGVEVADRVRIKAFSHLEHCRIAAQADIGPYARLRPGAKIGEGARIGNFVEVKKAEIRAGAKVNHLSYIGDAVVGEKANIGAGTITCNYDGFFKYSTEIGTGAFIGSNTALVAPVKIGDGAIVGAGSTLSADVAPDALVLERAKPLQKDNWAARFRENAQAKKAK